ncbi:HAMP domain-containing sensor histidine kinase [Dactylosporangium sp. NPDC049525]|uniref:sensor histidine kinase n=1 Tax=Dactylosporangium sp. NPDC049525 TaxID=3154730 RepID=UPI003436C124
MTAIAQEPAPPVGERRPLRWKPRLTFRARLTLTFTVVLAITGVLMVTTVSTFMRTIPTYLESSGHPSESAPLATSPDPDQGDTAGVTTSQTTPGSDLAAPTDRPLMISLRSPQEILNTTLVVSLLVLVALVVVGAVVAWLLAGRMLRPLQALNRAAKRAGNGSFDHRVGLQGPHDELQDLSDTFDDMLTRLDQSFAASNRFAANASHELRTPLAATQTMLEVALADPDADVDELRAVARRVLETNRRNIQTVDALLDLTEINHHEPSDEPVTLASVARDALRDGRAEIESRCIIVETDLDENATTRGDSVLLHQAIRNLVSNATRHNINGGQIQVSVSQLPRHTRFRIENTGARVPAELVASLTEPFVRGAGRTTSNTESVRGHGLGLAIVTSVTRAHHGELHLTPRHDGGLIAELNLPAGAPVRS